jgi:tetratricopeptide (TPR) repeat protein
MGWSCTMDKPRRARVFISYSHDSAEHTERVRRLADRLIGNGQHCEIDLYEPNPPQGWPAWMDRKLEEADFVLVVCTDGYFRKATATPQASGRGVKFESVLMLQDLYDSGMWNEKFIPVVFEDMPASRIPRLLRPYTRYRLDDDYTDLLRHITGQPRRNRPPPGRVPELPPEGTGSDAAGLTGAAPEPADPYRPESSSRSEALPRAMPRPEPLRRWREALIRETLRRRRSYLTAGALVMTLGLGFGAARWLCASIPLLSFFCTSEELYLEGEKLWEKLDTRRSLQLFEQAIAKQPDRWLAYSGLAAVLHELGRDDEAAKRIKPACNHAGRLSRLEELLITARCAQVESRWDKAVESYEELHRQFPDRLEFGLGLVQALDAAGRGEEALRLVHSLQAQSNMAGAAARLYLAEADVAAYNSDFTRCYQSAGLAEKLAERQGDGRIRARAWLLQGMARASSDPQAALVPLGKAEDFYSRTGDLPNLAQVLDATAELLFKQGSLEPAREKSQRAAAVDNEVGNSKGKFYQLLRLAAIEAELGNFTEAENRFASAINEYRGIISHQELALAYSNMGVVLDRQGQHAEALKNYEDALRLYHEMRNRHGEATQLEYLAEDYLELNLKEAADRLEKAKHLAADGDQELMADVLADEGDVAAASGKPDLARQRYEEAKSKSSGIGDKRGSALRDLALAGLELDQGRPIQARADAQGALKQFHSYRDEENEARAGAVLAVALVVRGFLDDAESAIEGAEKLAAKSLDPNVQVTVELAASRVHAKQGKPEQALRDLARTLEKAQLAGLNRRAFEVRLALGEIEAAQGNRKHAAEILTELERDARSRGFLAVAERAARLRAAGSA